MTNLENILIAGLILWFILVIGAFIIYLVKCHQEKRKNHEEYVNSFLKLLEMETERRIKIQEAVANARQLKKLEAENTVKELKEWLT